MRKRIKKPCGYPGCSALVQGGGYCPGHRRRTWREQDQRRPTATQRGYDHRWRKARDAFLAQRLWCVECERSGRLTPATVVDHIIPHKGDKTLFWDMKNWQALCSRCHNRKTATEDGGFGREVKRRKSGRK